MTPGDMRSFLDALDEPAMIVDGHLIALANQAARDLLGQRIEGNDIRLAIRHPQALEHILPGAAGDMDVVGIGDVGRPWTVSVRKLDHHSIFVRLIDRSSAAAAEKMRVDFVANASHELRTPLSTILGYAETLSDDAKLDPQLCGRFGGIIRSEAKRMLRIIEDLMSLSRIEAGRFVAPTDRISIREVMERAAENAANIADAQQCRIEIDIEQALPPVVGDSGQLMQLFDNLLTNAVRYGCEQLQCEIRFSARRTDEWVRISVADNGPGIARDHLPRVTERFYRADPARSRDSGGTGLGLAIVKHIVERHRGTLDIRSQLHKGTEVIVSLPLLPRQAGVS